MRRSHNPRAQRAGVTLLESLLAFLVILPLILLSSNLIARYVDDQASALEVAHLARVADGTAAALLPDLPRIVRVTQTAGRATTYSAADLRALGAISNDDTLTTALGRNIQVITFTPTTDVLLIMARSQTPAGQTARTRLPVLGEHSAMVGYISPTAPTRLRGPGLDMDLAALNSAGITFDAGDVVALRRLSFAGNTSPYLHRRTVADAPELTRMETDLVMNGASIINAGNISADLITVGSSLTTNVLNAPTTINNDITFNGGLDVKKSIIASTVTADVLSVQSQFKTQNITELANLTVRDLTITSNVNAQDLTVNGAFLANDITSENATVNTVTAQSANIGAVQAISGLFIAATTNSLQTATIEIVGGGSCTGC